MEADISGITTKIRFDICYVTCALFFVFHKCPTFCPPFLEVLYLCIIVLMAQCSVYYLNSAAVL